MSLSEAVRSGFDHFSNWKGRASRPAYWWLYLASLIAWFVPFILASAFGGVLKAFFLLVAFIAAIAFIVPMISAVVRRLHDTGRSGWWYFISFVPLIGFIWLLVLLLLDGDPGDNQYGPNPAGGVSEPNGAPAIVQATEDVAPPTV